MSVISDQKELSAVCDKFSREKFICVDTEFMRERTYYPKLCLIQLAGKDEAIAIDPLVKDIDLTPLFGLMANPDVLKVFHACRQDMEIFFNLSGNLPSPLFATQISAMVCGYGEAISYDNLVRKLIGIEIDKSSRFTDWSKRPLTKQQIGYALSDVIYLRNVYENLQTQLRERNRETWLEEEIKIITNPDTYKNDPQNAWRRLKIRSGKPRFIALVHELAAFREMKAQKTNVPRNRILRDDVLLDIAARAPRTIDNLTKVRNISLHFASGSSGGEILAVVKKVLDQPLTNIPNLNPKNNVTKANPAIVELLKVLLKMKCETHEVAQKLIATTQDLEAIATDDNADVIALSGWRRRIFGEDALLLKKGLVALSARGTSVKLIRLQK